jgi:hypothetical protein
VDVLALLIEEQTRREVVPDLATRIGRGDDRRQQTGIADARPGTY